MRHPAGWPDVDWTTPLQSCEMAGERARVTTLGAREASVLALAPLERAQAIAAHESPRTTKLYDRTADEVTVEDIEKIEI